MYADLDFILALCKDEDWLKERALEIYKTYKNSIWTSQIAIEEAFLYAKKYNRNEVAVIESIYATILVRNVEFTKEKHLEVALIMQEHRANTFDALHAVAASEDGAIISSDSIYDRIGLKRIKLEERP